MTTTSTHTTTYTRTHTSTHLSDVIMSSIVEILAILGINASGLDWGRDSTAIAAWIEEGSLRDVRLECHRPSGAVDPIFVFTVQYTAGGFGDKKFTADNASLIRWMAKSKSVPSGTTYQLFCTYLPGMSHSSQAGWGPGTSADTAGLRSRTVGTLAGGPHATATTSIYSS